MTAPDAKSLTVRIARRKVSVWNFRGFNYIYDVSLPDGTSVVYGAGTLGTARRKAREAAKAIGAQVSCTWEGSR